MADKRLAVVTGAARGIGRAIVFELLRQGRIVAGLDIIDDLTKFRTVHSSLPRARIIIFSVPEIVQPPGSGPLGRDKQGSCPVGIEGKEVAP